MEKELEQCKSKCDKGSFCPGADCFRKGYDAAFVFQAAMLVEIDELRSEFLNAQKQLEKLIEGSKNNMI